MKKFAIAATVLTLGIGAYSLPAFAQADDYGQYAWTDMSPSRFAPGGIAGSSGDFRATIRFAARAAAAQQSQSANALNRIDADHKAW